MGTPVVCLLPARNAAEHLPAWLNCAGRFADAVVALDDGSTDATREILSSHPLVRRVLTNKRRPGYEGWDDAANRSRLLAAAADLDPRWIMQLDADERIPADDADALRTFLDGDADPGYAYLFRMFRMVGNADQYDIDGPWVGRLFAFAPGQCFPTDRLHFVPVPTSIGRSRWLRTTIRIKHLSSLTAELRRQRFEKYRQADPDRRYQASYSHLTRSPVAIHRWRPRPPSLPFLANTANKEPDAKLPLSVVVIAQNDEAVIERTVGSVVHQDCPDRFEVILVTSGTDRTAGIIRARFPAVRVIELDGPALPGAARNAGLATAGGQYVAFVSSHAELGTGALAARIRAHRQGWAMVAGAVLNGTPTPSGWASYFLDNTPALPGRKAGTMHAAPVRCSYLREAVNAIGGFPADRRAGEDTVVNDTLFDIGYGAYFAPDDTMYHHSPCRTARRLLVHHYARGRGLGRILLERRGSVSLRRYIVFGVPSRLRATWRQLNRWGPDLRARFVLVLPLVVAGAASAWAGMCRELASGLIVRRPVADEARGTPRVRMLRSRRRSGARQR